MDNTTTVKRNWIFWGIYMVIMVALAVFWSAFGLKFSHQKGDDFVNCICCTVIVTYVALVLFYLLVDRLNVLVLLLIPVGTACSTMMAGFLLLLTFGLDGTPAQVNAIYPPVYGLLTIGLMHTMIKAKRKKQEMA